MGILWGTLRGILCRGKKGLIPYRVLYIAVAVIAPVVALDVVWDIADILNALMAIPNLIAVLLLSTVIVKETKKYLDDLDAKDDTEIPVIQKIEYDNSIDEVLENNYNRNGKGKFFKYFYNGEQK